MIHSEEENVIPDSQQGDPEHVPDVRGVPQVARAVMRQGQPQQPTSAPARGSGKTVMRAFCIRVSEKLIF